MCPWWIKIVISLKKTNPTHPNVWTIYCIFWFVSVQFDNLDLEELCFICDLSLHSGSSADAFSKGHIHHKIMLYYSCGTLVYIIILQPNDISDKHDKAACEKRGRDREQKRGRTSETSETTHSRVFVSDKGTNAIRTNHHGLLLLTIESYCVYAEKLCLLLLCVSYLLHVKERTEELPMTEYLS